MPSRRAGPDRARLGNWRRLARCGANIRVSPCKTHIAENRDEVAFVTSLFPERKDFLDIYDHYGLVRRRSVLGHCIWFSDSEFDRVHERDASIAHCPTSNLFLGSGLFRMRVAKDPNRPIHVGLATDLGAGTSFSALQTMNEAYKVSALNAAPLTAFEALYLATLGGAEALGLADRIGSLQAGREADIVVLDPGPRRSSPSARRVHGR